MPAQKVEYVDRPFVREPYRDSGYGRTLADLMLQRGNQAAALHLQRGDDQARMWQQAGGAVMGAVQDWTQRTQMEQERQRQAQIDAENSKIRGLQVQQSEGVLQDQQAARTRRERAEKADDRFASYFVPGDDGTPQFDMAKIAKDFEAEGLSGELPRFLPVLEGIQNTARTFRNQQRDAIAGVFAPMLNDKEINPESVKMLTSYLRKSQMAPAEELDYIDQALDANPASARQIVTAIVSSGPEVGKKWREPEEFTIGPGQKRFRGESEIASVPPEAPNLTFRDGIDPATGRPAVLGFNPQTGQAQPTGVAPVPPREPRGEAVSLQSREVLDENGRPITVNFNPRTGTYTTPDGRAITNPRPASTREQGRQVTSGDAGRIAEFNTALDDVATLTGTLKGNKATGAAAQVGAALPNAVTELTGWGTDAKQKQAVIDRVKQVIGKALEGGVLRKEDEAKYAKILPTIGDPADVVEAKLNGLRAALELRQQRTIEALDDAGYDTSKYRARPGGAGAAGAGGWEVIDGIKVRVKP
jgi:hypothetical protein